jgi:peptidoglycan/LPS O-acetylase OafA/YrhL
LFGHTTSSGRFYRPELDAVRFLAFGLVFLFHAGASINGEMLAAGGYQASLAKLLPAGAYGVDVFFLLSAFLITELFMREKARSGTIDIPAFYARRILRIWPLYFSFVILTIVLSRFTPVQFPGGAIAPMLLFYGNFWLMYHSFFSPAGILWSISVEEQFYVLCPFATKFLSKNGLAVLAVALIALANLTRFLLLHFTATRPDAIWYCTLTRLDPIATGILACLVLNGRIPKFCFRLRCVLLSAGAFCLYSAAVWLHGMDSALSIKDCLMVYPVTNIGALAIFLSFLGASITWRPAIYLGHISYGLYVYHLLALNVAKIGLLRLIGECPYLLRAAVALPLTIGLAAISYRFLEAPFLRLKDHSNSSFKANWPMARFRRK